MKTLKSTLVLLALATLTAPLLAQELRVPHQALAGEGASLSTTGSGKATLYVVGPGTTLKREEQLGGEISLSGDELANAGRYTAILLCKGEPAAQSFYVVAAKPAKLNFMARPSRVPVAHPDVISGTVFVLDRNDNLVTTPTPVNFQLGVNGSATNRSVTSKNGVAWTKAASGNREGAAQFTVSVGDVSEKRVVQQVASDPCNLRMKAQREGQNLRLETEPVKDCSGNAVPDATIETFSESSGGDRGRSTVDARVKHGIARATLPAVPGSTLSVASGVVLGNEIRWGAQ
jgi:hypothetical protein